MAVHGRSGDLDAHLAASGDEMLAAEVLTGHTHHGLMPTTPERAAIGRHGDIADAVRSRDAAAAEWATHAIISEVTGAMLGE